MVTVDNNKNEDIPLKEEGQHEKGDTRVSKEQNAEVTENFGTTETWGNQLEFILACLGYSVGLGNIWRFPYLCMANGGAAFVIAYTICLVFCAMPLYFLEICLGQFSGHSAIAMWKISPLFKGLGYAMTTVTSILLLYFNIIIAWSLYYLFRSFTLVLPWISCGNPWNTPLCLDEDMLATINNLKMDNMDNFTAGVNSTAYNVSNVDMLYIQSYTQNATIYANISGNESVPWRSSAEEFWLFQTLERSAGVEDVGGIKWDIFGYMWLTWVITFFCFIRGIKSLGKVVYVTACAPYVLLTILMFRATTLPGAILGLKYYLIPDMEKLLEFKVWTAACLQVFYSLGPSWGGIITMASFNKFHSNCVRDGIIVPIITGLTSMYGGIVVFSIVGFMAQETGTEVTSFMQSGPGLVFIAYPRALAKLPAAPLWSILFFLMLFFLGMGSIFCSVEGVIGTLVDEYYKKLKKHSLWVTFTICFISGCSSIIFSTRAGVYYVQIADWYVAAFSIFFIALLECLALCYFYGHERVYYDIELMTGKRLGMFWKICWCFITPLMILVILVYTCFTMTEAKYGDYVFPQWIIVIGWIIGLSSIVPIPVYCIYAIATQKGTLLDRLRVLTQPTEEWGPKDEQARKQYNYVPSGGVTSQLCCRKRSSPEDMSREEKPLNSQHPV